MKVRLIVAIMALALVVGIVLAAKLKQTLLSSPGINTTCVNEFGRTLTYTIGTPLPEEFGNCIRNHAKLFMERDYPESKDLAKSFLTLLTAVLVASITFSEKIVDFGRARWPSKALMIVCWLSLLGSIITCGIGLAFMAQAAGYASYRPYYDYRGLEGFGSRLFLIAGISFVFGLSTMLAAGIISLVRHENRAASVNGFIEPNEKNAPFQKDGR